MYKQLAISFLFLFFVAVTAFVSYRLSKPKENRFSKKKAVLHIILLLYLCGVATVTIVPLQMSEYKGNLAAHFNFIPFFHNYHHYFDLVSWKDELGLQNFWTNVFGNIILFIPYGILLPLAYPATSFGRIIFIATISSCLIESIQYINMFFGYYRFVDIDDVLLNVLGAIIGYGILRLLISKRRQSTHA